MSDLKIDLAKESDAPRIYELMKKVYDGLQDKSLFFCDDMEYVNAHIKKEGFAIKVEDNESLVASLVVRYPHNVDDNLGRDISLPVEEYCRVAHLESIVVDETYRGRGLQDKMIRYAEKIIEETGYRHLMATVSPNNKHSLRNFEKNGYKLMVTKEKYGGLMRAVLYKMV